MFGPPLALKMLQGEHFFSVYLKGAPQAAFVSRSEIDLAGKEDILFEQLKGAVAATMSSVCFHGPSRIYVATF